MYVPFRGDLVSLGRSKQRWLLPHIPALNCPAEELASSDWFYREPEETKLLFQARTRPWRGWIWLQAFCSVRLPSKTGIWLCMGRQAHTHSSWAISQHSTNVSQSSTKTSQSTYMRPIRCIALGPGLPGCSLLSCGATANPGTLAHSVQAQTWSYCVGILCLPWRKAQMGNFKHFVSRASQQWNSKNLIQTR